MDRIDSVAVFAEVAERGSFADAARRLNRSPAAVTRAVAELEARLGVRLLNRTTRAVSVTEPGQRFLAGARRVLADLAEIEQAAIGQGSAPRGELRVTAPIVFGRRHVLPLVTDFLAQYPEVSVRLDAARPAGRSGRGRARCRDPHRRAGRHLGDRDPRRRAAARRGRGARLSEAARPAEDAGAISPAHDVIAFAGMDRIERWRFAGGVEAPIKPRLIVNTAEAAIDAAVVGIRHHPRAELPGRRCAGGPVAGAAAARSTKPGRHPGPRGLSRWPPSAAEAPRISRCAGAAPAAALRRHCPIARQ